MTDKVFFCMYAIITDGDDDDAWVNRFCSNAVLWRVTKERKRRPLLVSLGYFCIYRERIVQRYLNKQKLSEKDVCVPL